MSKTNTHIVLRPVTLADIPLLQRWDQQPHVISAITDNPSAKTAFEDMNWHDEILAQNEHSEYQIAECNGRPVGAMQIIDPHLEATHYWGKIAPNLRALDIWIGEPDCLGKGYGDTMMRIAIERCFAEAEVTAIVIDPLNSNKRAHKFYQRLGFKPLGRRMFDEDDCLVHELTRPQWLNTSTSD